jgi:hypothetical protein
LLDRVSDHREIPKSSFFSWTDKEKFCTYCTERTVEIPSYDHWVFSRRGLAPFASSSILNENRMMDSNLTEAYFIWHAQSIFPSFGTGLCRKWNVFH